MKKLIVFATLLFLSTSLFAATKSLKVAFVYVSPVGNSGWSFQHDLGRRAAVKFFGDKITTKFVESVKEGPDSERVIRKLASSGYQLIFTTSFGFMNPTMKVAQAFPKVTFEQATGYKKSKNVGNFSPRFYEGRYLSGIHAAAIAETDVIGYVAAFPIPEVLRGINAFTLGAQSINPNIKIKVIWTNSWFDPPKETEATNTLISQGASVMTHHTDSAASIKTASDLKVRSISYHSNLKNIGKDYLIGAVVHKWEEFYINKINSVLDDKWESESLWYGIVKGMVNYIVTDSSNARIQKLIDIKKQNIINKTFHPFQGPIKNRDGEIVVKEGEKLTDVQLLNMDYFVEGVQGKY